MQIVENKMLHNIDLSLSGSQSLKFFYSSNYLTKKGPKSDDRFVKI